VNPALTVALEAADREERISAWWWLWDRFDFAVQAELLEEATAPEEYPKSHAHDGRPVEGG
jgi:hypothetical protein